MMIHVKFHGILMEGSRVRVTLVSKSSILRKQTMKTKFIL